MQRGCGEGVSVSSDGSRKMAKGPMVLREGSRESEQLLASWRQAVRLKGVLAPSCNPGPICRCLFLAHPSRLTSFGKNQVPVPMGWVERR